MEYRYGDNKEIDQIILDTHNEYRKQSANWGKGKEIQAICDRTGLDKKIVKQALMDMEHPYGLHYETEKEKAQKAEKQRRKQEYKQHQQEYKQRQKELNEQIYGNLVKLSNLFGDSKTARCPRCKSTSITYDGSKPSVGRAVVGGAVAGPAGAVIGGMTGKKGYAVCLKCGKRWKV